MGRLRVAAPSSPWGFLVPDIAAGEAIGPLNLSKADATRWRYRVAKWNVSMTAGGTINYVTDFGTYQFVLDQLAASTTSAWGPPGNAPNPNMLEGDLLVSTVNPARLGNPALAGTITGAATSTFPGHTAATATGNVGFYLFPRTGARGYQMTYNPDTGTFSPMFSIDATLTVYDGVNSVTIALVYPPQVLMPSYAFFALPATGQSTATIETTFFPVQGFLVNNSRYATAMTGPNVSVGADFTVSVLATPGGYFPYVGQTDLFPLYNSGDGTPATNPVTNAPFTPAEIAAASFP